MTELLAASAITVALGVVTVLLVLLARRMRGRGTAGSAIAGAMAAYDEAMHSTAHDQYVEVQAQKDRTTPIPSLGKD